MVATRLSPSRCVFKDRLAIIAAKSSLIEHAKDLMSLLGELMFDTQFMSQSGRRDFDAYMMTLMTTIGTKKHARGIAEGRDHMG